MISELKLSCCVTCFILCAVLVSCGVVARSERLSPELKFDLTPYMLCLLTLALRPQQAAETVYPTTILDRHQLISSRSQPMEVTAKPGADLLWAFQLHREHRALSKRLAAVETSTSNQQERITASEHTAQSHQHERFDALTERLRKLEDADVSEQIAGLASELRTTRQQLEQARDKVKVIEKANKDVESKNQEKERDVQIRIGEFADVVAQTQNALHALEGRLGLAVDAAGRTAADGLATFGGRYEEQIGGLSEQLRRLERVQAELRALVESDRRDRITATVLPVPTVREEPKITEKRATRSKPSHTHARNEQRRIDPQGILESPEQEQTDIDVPVPQRPTNITPATAKITTFAGPKKPPAPSYVKRKRGLEKEISQLIFGHGSLTNAPVILEDEEVGATTRGSKRLKAQAEEGTSLRLGVADPSVPTKDIKKEPVTRAKALSRSTKTAVDGKEKLAKTVTTKTKGRKAAAKPRKTAVAKKPLLSTSIEVQVASSRTPSASEQPHIPPNLAGPPLPVKSEKNTSKQNEQRPQQRRRRIEQDDSMEEFLAKCEAAAEM